MHRVWSAVWLAALATACAPPVSQQRGARAPLPERVARSTEDDAPPPRPPPPITGGTLLATRDGLRAVLSDAERDRVWIVELEGALVAVGRFELRAGDAPGRLVEDGAGRVHVVLRGAGEIASFDPIGPRAIGRRAVCDSPRGIDWDRRADVLHVACADGAVVTLAPGGGPPLERRFVASDLRDVIVDRASGKVSVSRFRAAELIGLDDVGATTRVPAIELASPMFLRASGPYAAAVAWRTVASPSGGAWMVHQREWKGELVASAPSYYGGGVVQTGLTHLGELGVERTVTIDGSVLPVDVAVSERGVLGVVFAGDGEVRIFDPNVAAASDLRRDAMRAVGGAVAVGLRRPVATAWAGDTLLVQYLDPPALAAYGSSIGSGETFLELGAPPPRDEGYEIFHTPTQARIACASCHPEGMDDGHVWQIGGVGRRRTQPLGGGILDTAPYHWAGDLLDVRAFTDSIYVERMGGVRLDDHQVEALGRWVHSIADPAPGAVVDAEAVARGRGLFEGEAGCASCHAGPRGTDLRTHDVGTGGSFQTPPLAGIAQRAPYFHDGCARTLEERFDRCHTDGHGNVATLDARERADLIAFIASR